MYYFYTKMLVSKIAAIFDFCEVIKIHLHAAWTNISKGKHSSDIFSMKVYQWGSVNMQVKFDKHRRACQFIMALIRAYGVKVSAKRLNQDEQVIKWSSLSF